MASYVRNICAKNHQNPLILFKVTIDNVGVPFFETQCILFTVVRYLMVNKVVYIKSNTRKLSYHRDNRVMRSIYGCPVKFLLRVPGYAHCYCSRNF